ncbi:MAG: acyltransferase [Desulfobacterales bacterium]|nr:acyltransferase [Desulfobacterales bacterium]
MSSIPYRNDIDALRGVAVLLVVVYHAFPWHLPGGFVGVDVFFVISGYLITGIIHRALEARQFSIVRFYERRIRRIFPTLLLVLATALALGWLVLFPEEFKQLGSHVFYTTLFIQNFALIRELGYFDAASHYKPLLHLWSLGIEEQYYFLWPGVLIFIHRFKGGIHWILAGLILVSFGINVYFAGEYTELIFYHSMARFWELGIGSFLALIPNQLNKIPPRYRPALFLTGMGLILWAVATLNGKSPYPSWAGLMPTVGTALVIAARIQRPHWWGLVKIGLISYPLYLWHWIFISFLHIYLGKVPSGIQMLGAIALSFLFSWMTFRYIEPLRYKPGRGVVVFLVVAMVAVGSWGGIIQVTQGRYTYAQQMGLGQFNIDQKRVASTDPRADQLAKTSTGRERQFNYSRLNTTDPGDVEKKRPILALIGDSHAHSIYPGISKLARAHGYDTLLMANSACPPLQGFPWGNNPAQMDACQDSIAQILSVLENQPRIQKVILTTRGPCYIHGHIQEKFSDPVIEKSLETYPNPDRLTYASFFDGFDRTFGHMEALGHIRETYYLLEVPELDFLPKETLSRPFRELFFPNPDNRIQRKFYQRRMEKYQREARQRAEKFPKLRIIDPEPILCREESCFSFRDAHFLYGDDTHLSIFGAHYLAQKIAGQIFDTAPVQKAGDAPGLIPAAIDD